MFDLNDTDYMKAAIEESEEYTGETLTVLTISASSGTSASMEPRSITWGSTDLVANVKRVSAREINESGGIYKSDDMVVYSSGSFSEDAKLVYRSGTYDVIEKPSFTCIDEQDLRYKVVIRRA